MPSVGRNDILSTANISLTSNVFQDNVEAYFLQGIQAFNEKQYRACHGALVELWRKLQDSQEKSYVQAIIQIAVALYHDGRKNAAGYELVRKKGLSRIERLTSKQWATAQAPTRLVQVDLAHLLSAMDTYHLHREETAIPRLTLLSVKNKNKNTKNIPAVF